MPFAFAAPTPAANPQAKSPAASSTPSTPNKNATPKARKHMKKGSKGTAASASHTSGK